MLAFSDPDGDWAAKPRCPTLVIKFSLLNYSQDLGYV